MLSNLLLYRFVIFNTLMFALVAALAWNGVLAPIYQNDQSGLTIAITVLFAVGWLWALKETVIISLDLNESRSNGPEPACYAKRDKDVAKTEWLTSISEWLVGLGLLGTVIGFSIALSGIDEGSVANATGAQGAVASLMSGMRVALNTTLLGAALAIWHEVNMRMLRTALTVYWSDRIAVWQMGRSEP
jgi:hypothetical protein